MLGSLRSALYAAEGATGRLSTLAFGSGVATSVFLMATYLPHAQAAFDHENTSDTSVDALVRMGDAFFGGAALFAIPMLVATALAILRFGALPRWAAYLSLVVALVLAIPPVSFFGLVLGIPVWVVAMSVLLYRPTPAVQSAP